ncbi:MAG: septum formation initiator family protein [Clostridiales Family XIII bacterium]|jgi:cell division protein FtsB|nr:septum formation initiator family protein [Clostridiales Family XIII bacterium]
MRIIEIEEAQAKRRKKREEQFGREKAKQRAKRTRAKQALPKMTPGKKLAALGVVVVAVLLFCYNGLRIIDLNLDKADYEKQLAEKQSEKVRLEKELAMIGTPEYIEQEARSRFHMLKDGELLYVFSEQQADNTR